MTHHTQFSRGLLSRQPPKAAYSAYGYSMEKASDSAVGAPISRNPPPRSLQYLLVLIRDRSFDIPLLACSPP